MKQTAPYVIEEMKANLTNIYGASIDSVYSMDVPVTVEFEYAAGDDIDPPQVRQMAVKCAQDWTLGTDGYVLIINQGTDITQMLDVATESKIEQAMIDRMAAQAADENEAAQLHAAGGHKGDRSTHEAYFDNY